MNAPPRKSPPTILWWIIWAAISAAVVVLYPDSDTDGAVVFADRGSSPRRHLVTRERLMALAATPDCVVVCEEKWTRVWRVPFSGFPTVAVLMDPEEHPLVYLEFGYGAMHCVGEVLWFASADQLVAFDLSALSWKSADTPVQ